MYMYIYTYMCANVVVTLRNDQVARFRHGYWACGFLACRFLAGRSSFICHEDSAWFSTLKIDRWACNALWAFRPRGATCGAEQLALDISTLQLHTLQTMKGCTGPGNVATVRASKTVRTSCVRAATCRVQQWVQ